MSLHDFIFTKKKPDMYLRHVLCWLSRLGFLMLYRQYITIQAKFNMVDFLGDVEYYSFVTLVAMIYTYTIVYYLYPKYFNLKTPGKFLWAIVIFTIVIYGINYAGTYRLWNLAKLPFEIRAVKIWNITVHFTTSGPPVVCCLFLISKIIKNLFIQVENRAILARENAEAEMQLLKAQVHPHFLFNTLNNIYSFILRKSPNAKDLIIKLSDTLKYMINECKVPMVPLDKELKMIEDYMGLEKVRYDKSLVMQIVISGDSKNKMIAPLLLVPFVENSFKHGSSKILKNPWIKFRIMIREDMLHMELSNSKPPDVINQNGKAGIGLKNVVSRLELLYPGRHKLIIKSDEETFSVHMTVPLKYGTEANALNEQSRLLETGYQNPSYSV